MSDVKHTFTPTKIYQAHTHASKVYECATSRRGTQAGHNFRGVHLLDTEAFGCSMKANPCRCFKHFMHTDVHVAGCGHIKKKFLPSLYPQRSKPSKAHRLIRLISPVSILEGFFADWCRQRREGASTNWTAPVGGRSLQLAMNN